jgi:hypothetical protein
MTREELIAHSVVRALVPQPEERPQTLLRKFLAALSALFAVFQLCLYRVSPGVFADLRQKKWELKDDDYVSSFVKGEADEGKEDALHSIGDMGFSGSV